MDWFIVYFTQTSTANVFNRSLCHFLTKAENQKSREAGNRNQKKRNGKNGYLKNTIYIYYIIYRVYIHIHREREIEREKFDADWLNTTGVVLTSIQVLSTWKTVRMNLKIQQVYILR